MSDHPEIQNVEVGGVDMSDYPDFCDAYIVSAEYAEDERPLTDEELEAVNRDTAFVYEQAMESIS